MKPNGKGAYGILQAHSSLQRQDIKNRLLDSAGLNLDRVHWFSNRMEKAMPFDFSDLQGTYHEEHPIFRQLLAELITHNKLLALGKEPSIYKEHTLRLLKKMLKEIVVCSDKHSLDNDLNRILDWFRKVTVSESMEERREKLKPKAERSASKGSPAKGKLAESTFLNRPVTTSSNFVSTRPQTSNSNPFSSSLGFSFVKMKPEGQTTTLNSGGISTECLFNEKMKAEEKKSWGDRVKRDESAIDKRLVLISHKDSKQKSEDKEFVAIMKSWSRNKSLQATESTRTRESLLTASRLATQPKIFLRKSPLYQSTSKPNLHGNTLEDEISIMRTRQYREKEERILGKARNVPSTPQISLSCHSQSQSLFKPLSIVLPTFNPSLKEQASFDQEIDKIKKTLESKGLSVSMNNFTNALQRPATSHYSGMPFAGRTLQSNPFVKEERKKTKKKTK